MTDRRQPDDDAPLRPDELAVWEATPLSDDFEDRVMRRAAQAETASLDAATVVPLGSSGASAAGGRPIRRGWILMAAAVALLGGGVLYSIRPTVDGDVRSTQSRDGIAVAVGARWVPEEGAKVHWDGAAGRAVQDAGRVRYQVPRGTEFAVETEAARVTVKGTQFTVEVLEMNRETKRKLQAVGALAMGATAVAVYVHSGSVEVSNAHGTVELAAEAQGLASRGSAPRRIEPTRSPPKAASPLPKRVAARKLRPGERERVERQISRAVAAATAPSRPSPSKRGASEEDDEAQPTGRLDKEYIRTIVQDDLVPLAKECYENALEDTPDLAGKIVLSFGIAGDESVGGIVESLEVGEESSITDPLMVECISESTKSLLFDPPQGGGRVQVKYPIVFQPEPAEHEALRVPE